MIYSKKFLRLWARIIVIINLVNNSLYRFLEDILQIIKSFYYRVAKSYQIIFKLPQITLPPS